MPCVRTRRVRRLAHGRDRDVGPGGFARAAPARALERRRQDRRRRRRYSVLCREDGGVLDLFTYRLGDDRYLTVTNAANHERDLAWFREHAGEFDLRVADRLADWAMLAVQGPGAREIVAGLADGELPARMRRHGRRRRRRVPRLRHKATRARTGWRSSVLPRTPKPCGPPCSARAPRRLGAPRHAAPRGLLSPLRQRPDRGSQPDRGRARLVRRRVRPSARTPSPRPAPRAAAKLAPFVTDPARDPRQGNSVIGPMAPRPAS